MDPTEIHTVNRDGSAPAVKDQATEVDSISWQHTKPLRNVGDYQLGAEIGRGGMGVVYAAEEIGLGRQVAVKLLPQTHCVSELQVKRFINEARAAAQLNHDHIVPVYQVGEQDGIHYYAMKLIDGCNLSEVVENAQIQVHSTKAVGRLRDTSVNTGSTIPTASDRPAANGFRTPGLSDALVNTSSNPQNSRSALAYAKNVAQVGIQVAEALHHAHLNGVIHRDIKPSNLLLDSSNKTWVTDFGLAQLQSSPSLTHTGDIVGTLRYMSPEQASGRRGFVDSRTDVYSLGITLYELATLHRAWQGSSAKEILREITFERPVPMRKIKPSLPRDFETIVCKATERNPDDRYQTAGELADDLRRFANNESLVARRPSHIKRIRQWFGDRPSLTIAMVIAGFMLLALSSVAGILAVQNLALSRAALAESRERLTALEAAYLVTESANERQRNPGRSVALAVEGAERLTSITSNRALMLAIDENHEVQTFDLNGVRPGPIAMHPKDNRVLLGADPRFIPGDNDSYAQSIDLNNGSPRTSFSGIANPTSIAYSRHGRWVIAHGNSLRSNGPSLNLDELERSPVAVWEAVDGTSPKLFRNSLPLRVAETSFSSNERLLVLPAGAQDAEIYQAPAWQRSLVLKGHSRLVLQAVFSPDDQKVATWSMDGTVKVWSVSDGKTLKTIPYETERPLSVDIEFLASSKKILVSGDRGSQVVDLNSEVDQVFYRRESTARVAKTSDRVLLLGDAQDSILILDPILGKVIAQCAVGRTINDFIVAENDDLVAAICGNDMLLFDSVSGDKLADLNGHTDRVVSLAISSRQRPIASVAYDGTLRVWNFRTDRQSRTFDLQLTRQGSPLVDYSEDGSRAMIASLVGLETRAFPLEDQAVLEHHDRATRIPGQLLGKGPAEGSLIVTEGGTTRVCDGSSGRVLWQTNVPADRVLEALTFKDSRHIVLRTSSGNVILWDLPSGHLSTLTGLGERAVACVLDSADLRVWIGLSDGSVTQFNIQEERLIKLEQLPAPITCVDYDDSSRRLIAIDRDGSVVFVDGEAIAGRHRLGPGAASITHVTFLPGGKRFLTHAGAASDTLSLWEADSGELVANLDVAEIQDIGFDEQAELCAVASRKAGCVLWNLQGGDHEVITDQPCSRVAFSKTHLLIASHARHPATFPSQVADTTKSEFATLRVWNLAEGAIEATTKIDFNISSIIVDDQGQVSFSGALFGAAVIDVESTRVITRLLGHQDALKLVGLGPGGNWGVTVARRGRILLHQISTGKRQEVGRHDFEITHAATSPDKLTLVTSDVAGIVRCWNLRTKKLVHEWKFEDSSLQQLAFNSDGTTLAGLSTSNELHFWDLRSNSMETISLSHDAIDFCATKDLNQILIVLGSARRIPRYSNMYTSRTRPTDEPDALLFSRSHGQFRNLFIDGDAVSGSILDSGRRLALHSTNGSIYLFGVDSLQEPETLDSQPPILSIVESDPESNHLTTVSRSGYTEWNVSTLKRMRDIPFDIAESVAATKMRDWELKVGDSGWMLLYGQRQLIKYPTSPVEYVKRRAPRLLTRGERKRYLVSEDVPE